MPPSQLKRLKASLHEQGITGPQKSKKQKKRGLSTEQRIQRHAALEGIREDFNPFEVKHLSRPGKRDVTTAKTMNGTPLKGTLGRPGVTKSLGEQKRRQVLLPELQRRNKVGGIVDRRIGENDPTMTPEERALERFTREKQKRKGISLFDLEDDDDEELLTHGGSKLDLRKDDFDEVSLGSLSDEDGEDRAIRKRKHAAMNGMVSKEDSELLERKKTKAEVMQEVIAKSKLYKYERQQAKEEDDVVREELDKDLFDVRAALNAFQNSLSSVNNAALVPASSAGKQDPFQMNPDRMALLNGTPNGDANKVYDQQLRKMALDKRARPTERTMTEEEKTQKAAERAKELEENRLKRMTGEDLDEDGKEDQKEQDTDQEPMEIDEDGKEDDDAAEFGLKIKSYTRPEGVDDEDDFVIEDDLVASGSELDDDVESDASSESEGDELLASADEASTFLAEARGTKIVASIATNSPLCPQTSKELKALLADVPYDGYQEMIREIRILHDPALLAENKEKLASFSQALVAYLAEIPSLDPLPPLLVTDAVIRHIHSMAKKFPDSVSNAFRSHLQEMHHSKDMTPGDLVILTAIGTVFPTSDHFHQIVTPAIPLMARCLGMTTPHSPRELATGAYVGALCLKYVSFSKRYVPELIRFTVVALKAKQSKEHLKSHLTNLISMADMWSEKSAFIEIFSPGVTQVLQSLLHVPQAAKALRHINLILSQSQLARRPLELHHHRPLPIKTAVPKFEESFDPTKHYDPDRERAESNRLQKEYKRERKGALRELRKDANFLAREKLREKKERDKAYEEKYKKLVADIQGEEGMEKNAYERVKKARKR